MEYRRYLYEQAHGKNAAVPRSTLSRWNKEKRVAQSANDPCNAGDRENGREERRQRAKSRKDEINENLLQSQSEAQNSAPPTEDQDLLLQPQSIFNFDLSSSEESE